jgi:NADH:ubiquinone oxidoreductase subunit C
MLVSYKVFILKDEEKTNFLITNCGINYETKAVTCMERFQGVYCLIVVDCCNILSLCRMF